MGRPADSNGLKRIGLVDYRLDNFHADVFLKTIRELRDTRGFVVSGAFALESTASAAWAKTNGIDFVACLEILDAHVDYYMILAPSNPELHYDLCARVFPFGKTTYVDKTFAPDLETASRIFDLADRHGVAVQTSSALRYTEVQSAVRSNAVRTRHLTVWGGGTSLDEYAIHPVELAVSCMGADAAGVVVLGAIEHPLIALHYDDARTATIHFNPRLHVPYQAAVTTDETTDFITVDDGRLFLNTASAILDFFDAGAAQIDRAESLLVRHILDIVSSPRAHGRMVPLHPERKISHVPPPKGILPRSSAATESRR